MELTAQVMTADDLVSACADAGLPLRLVNGWRERGRGLLSEWGPMAGVVLSHSGTSGARESVARVMHPSGGLGAQMVVAADGTVWVTGWGRASHCGQGSAEALAAVRAGRVPRFPVVNSVDGDRYFFGVVAAHSGDARDWWPAAQLDSMAALCAVLRRWHRWPGVPVLGQWEWRRGGRGPVGLDMTAMRQMVALHP